MEILRDYQNRSIRFTEERKKHIEQDHFVKSKTDNDVELFYKKYSKTPVTEKYLCIIVKSLIDDSFIITAYFTDTIKKGETIWRKK